VTVLARAVHELVLAGDDQEVSRLLPKETAYPANVEAILPALPTVG